MKTRAHCGCAFSLVEVVIAIGVLAVTLVAVLGLAGSTMRSGGATADLAVAGRLGAEIRGELERLKAELGLPGLAATIPRGGAAAPLRLVATRDGRRMLRADGAAAAANHALNDPLQPGIARRDRYFLAEVTQQLDLPYAPDEGFLALSVRVSWPYELPGGPATPGATAVDMDPAREVPLSDRTIVFFNFALRP